jgi:hypothetical protein
MRPASLQVIDILIPMRTFESSPLHDPHNDTQFETRPQMSSCIITFFSQCEELRREPSNLCIIYWAKTRIRELLLLTPLDKPKVPLKKRFMN